MTGLDCAICGRRLLPDDAVTSRRMRTAAASAAATRVAGYYWCHVACTDDGVKRWNRQNRPMDDPLEWVRSADPAWTRTQRPAHRGSLVR
jgi:hypothetical protein